MMLSPAPTAGIMRPALMKLRTNKVKPKANKPRGVALIPAGAASAAFSASTAVCAIEVSTFQKTCHTRTFPGPCVAMTVSNPCALACDKHQCLGSRRDGIHKSDVDDFKIALKR